MIYAAIQADEELPESVLTQSLEFSHRAAQRLSAGRALKRSGAELGTAN